jgi:hypothetical protein
MKNALLAGAAASILLIAGCDSSTSNNNGTGTSGTHRNTDAKRDHTVNPPPAPDNTKNNERDRNDANKTPLDQSNNSADIDITAKIRSAIVDDSAMSTNARNIKIITQNGEVTLRGVVDSQAEKDSIETKARAVAGVTRIDNQLEIKAPK